MPTQRAANLYADPYIPGIGTHLHWTFPSFVDIDVGNLSNFRLYLQRSATKTNWPLQPKVYDSPRTSPPTVDAAWTDVKSWTGSAATDLPTQWTDNIQPNPTYHYRLIVYFATDSGPAFSIEFDWLPASVSVTAPGQVQWGKTYIGGQSSRVYTNRVAYDSLDNVYAAGHFVGTVDFGDGNPITAPGDGSIYGYLAKYTSTGSLVWVKTFISPTREVNVWGMCIDALDNIIVTGSFKGSCDFGGTTKTAVSANFDVFIAKFASSGSLTWVNSYGGSFNDSGIQVATDSTNLIYLVGHFQSQPISFGATDLSALGTSGGYDIFLVKFTSTGTVTWAVQFGGTSDDLAEDIITTSTDNVVICGKVMGPTDIGGGTVAGTGAPVQDNFIAKYSKTDGAYVWGHVFVAGTSFPILSAVVEDPATNNILYAGGVLGTVNFGNGNVTTGSNGTGEAYYIVCFSSAGVWIWQKLVQDGTTHSLAFIRSIKIRNATIFITGYYEGWMDYNGDGLEEAGGAGFFVSKLAIAGNAVPTIVWTVRDSNNGFGNSVAINSLNKAVVGGVFVNSMTINNGFGGSSLQQAGFIAKFT